MPAAAQRAPENGARQSHDAAIAEATKPTIRTGLRIAVARRLVTIPASTATQIVATIKIQRKPWCRIAPWNFTYAKPTRVIEPATHAVTVTQDRLSVHVTTPRIETRPANATAMTPVLGYCPGAGQGNQTVLFQK
jgi:hypothetical protein